MDWRIHHVAETVSTNLDARTGRAGDVYTADYQTAGRGRLDHQWLSPPNTNLLMSAVLSVKSLSPEHISTLPLAVGLAVCRAIGRFTRTLRGLSPEIKWPNDVLIGGKKVAGILCERIDDRVIAGIGVNVKAQRFSPEIADRACFLEFAGSVPIEEVRDAILSELTEVNEKWRRDGFSAVYDEIRTIDYLKGRILSIRQTDDDKSPLKGVCGGILESGALLVGGQSVYAGEAHIEQVI